MMRESILSKLEMKRISQLGDSLTMVVLLLNLDPIDM